MSWIERIRKGDVLEAPSGRLRIVRKVTHHGGICGTYVTFAIGRQSWTNKPYTVMTGNDLRYMGYRPLRARWRLGSTFDKLIEAEMGDPRPKRLTARDVIGIA